VVINYTSNTGKRIHETKLMLNAIKRRYYQGAVTPSGE